MQASQQHILTKLLFILFYINQAVIQAQSINNPFQISTTSSNGAGGSGKARYKTVYACEDRMLHIECEHGTMINLIRANYGRFSITQCNEQGQLDLSTDCVSPITVRIMRRECQEKQSCSVNATSTTFGDKCPKTRKYLEAHFQCVPTSEVSTATSAIETVNLRTSTTPSPAAGLSPSSAQTIAHLSSHYEQPINLGGNPGGHVLPPNNYDSPFRNGFTGTNTRGQSPVQQFAPQTTNAGRYPSQQPQAPLPQQQNQQPKTVMNSEIVTYNEAMNDLQTNPYGPNNISSNNNNDSPSSITATFRHIHTDNMSNPRCMLWNQVSGEWTSRGARVIDTNFTHTTCAFDQQTSYLLVMDYLGPQSGSQTVSSLDQNPIPLDHTAPSRVALPSPSDNPTILAPLDSVLPNLLDRQPDPLYQANINFNNNKNGQPQLQQQQSNGPTSTNPSPVVSFFSLFGYLLAFVFVLVALMTIAFVVSSMRSSAGATLKSLGNFTAFSGPKYKSGGARRSDVSLHHHHNKDQLLVINNQNGHQFLYTPTNTTKINSSASTHILTSSLPGQHQGTLHQIQQQQQQQQLYSGNGTLSNMSGAGGQSNNYYSYGLTGLNQIFHQQQQQQHHLSQHQLSNNNNQQQQAGYHHQANKSTISNESANSSPSSSGVESGSTSMHQQQQQQQQQHHQQQQQCLVLNNDLNLMNHFGNYGHHQQQQQSNNNNNNNNSLAAGLSMQDHHTTLTLNAHYNSSVVPMRYGNGGLNPMSTREQHIYECVDDDKNYSARLLMPTVDQVFNSNTLNSHHHHHLNHQQSNNNVIGQQQQQQMQMQMGAANRSGAMTLSRFHQQQQQQQIPLQQQLQSQLQANKRLISHPTIVRDNQPAAKTNIICSQTAQVTPQRATEINKFQHDMMAVFNNDTASASTTTSTTGGGASATTTSSLLNGNNKLSTDC